jgi:hypothetical protein
LTFAFFRIKHSPINYPNYGFSLRKKAKKIMADNASRQVPAKHGTASILAVHIRLWQGPNCEKQLPAIKAIKS